ncbi:hypothetical protein HPP92_019801 [Vanilla planifolia]|uniref:Uncharacterized protein n=1 Tax=Vanilla planifolia TaxID=51239 RepID=A0A835UL35_VANPL|nr:hypothetical protein HPP92_019801 [Vanilla planifolia]
MAEPTINCHGRNEEGTKSLTVIKRGVTEINSPFPSFQTGKDRRNKVGALLPASASKNRRRSLQFSPSRKQWRRRRQEKMWNDAKAKKRSSESLGSE